MVEALRKGYWIVLDELNLAPSDVLEALNRLLDDNRELFLPETQETIRPHPHFMLFATQNPSGQYGGRKQLSRAFRNRFLELHFNDIPEDELEAIICQRCQIAPSYAKKLVGVYKALQSSRGKTRIFEGQSGFVTLRDLFRWAMRRADSYQKLGEDGYMILAERTRTLEDRETVKTVLEKELKVSISPSDMYDVLFNELSETAGLRSPAISASAIFKSIVWTRSMRRLFVLVWKCIENSEPILLVGETGCGKTTVCQLISELVGRHIHIINAHQHSETSDFLGSQRPTRNQGQKDARLLDDLKKLTHELSLDCQLEFTTNNIDSIVAWMKSHIENSAGDVSIASGKMKALATQASKRKILFEWTDGPLVQAMKNGDFFLIDEISLADDSVLERLNSVLEPAQLLVLPEKGSNQIEEIRASKGFQFFATMNPGGDYGKKELSPALRNRFTEVWVSSISDREDLTMILEKKLQSYNLSSTNQWHVEILKFFEWFSRKLGRPSDSILSLRDILAWIDFMHVTALNVGEPFAFYHGALMTVVDGIGMNPLFGVMDETRTLKNACIEYLHSLALDIPAATHVGLEFKQGSLGMPPFYISRGSLPIPDVPFTMDAHTTQQNAMRVLRGLQLTKPLLLEGSPGVGKTSLIVSLAALSGREIVRINLSEQTDLMDLLGSDLPVEGGSGGEFAWRDGPFLQALKEGKWVLLDELNLASQQVLEGLNACLDHRSSVYIPELDRTFMKHPEFRIFGAQNPHHQGGGRKGLPKSFVNRFTLVYLDNLEFSDLQFICGTLYRDRVPVDVLDRMIAFNELIRQHTSVKMTFGWQGSPWEFNLRDVMRWADLLEQHQSIDTQTPSRYLVMVYSHRFRTNDDRLKVLELYRHVFGCIPADFLSRPRLKVTPTHFVIGSVSLPIRTEGRQSTDVKLEILPSKLKFLESVAKCIQMQWMPLITGHSSSGKTSAVRFLAKLSGVALEEFSMNSGVDAVELLGGFEQEDIVRSQQGITSALSDLASSLLRQIVEKSLTANAELVLHLTKLTTNIPNPSVEAFKECISVLGDVAKYVEDEEAFVTLRYISGLLAQFSDLVSRGEQGRFKWVDGSLIRAMEQGHWILIDNVNLCSTSVLDRLNSLLEKRGVLMVNERGLVNGKVKVVNPHPNFRIFMTMDPTYGEISRAMRNRAVEIYLEEFDDAAQTMDTLLVLMNSQMPQLSWSDAHALLTEKQKSLSTKSNLWIAERERGLQDFAKPWASMDMKPESTLHGHVSVNWAIQYHLAKTTNHVLRCLSHWVADSAYSPTSSMMSEKASNEAVLFEALQEFITWSKGDPIYFRLLRYCFFNLLETVTVKKRQLKILLITVQSIFRNGILVCIPIFVYLNDSRGLTGFDTSSYSHVRALYLRNLVLVTADQITTASAPSMTVLEQSISFSKQLIFQGDLSHDAVKYLYPLLNFSSLLSAEVLAAIKSDDSLWRAFLDAIYYLLEVVSDTALNISAAIVALGKLRKTGLSAIQSLSPSLRFLEPVQAVSNVMNEIFTCLNVDRIISLIKIWKEIRPHALKHKQCVELYDRIVSAEQALDISRAPINGNIFMLLNDVKFIFLKIGLPMYESKSTLPP